MENLSVLYLNSASANYSNLTRAEATFVMSPPIVLPKNSSIKIACSQFSFTNYFINVSAALANNVFTIQSSAPATFALTIPDGSYSVSELSSAINTLGINAGLADGLVQLIPDFSTNKVLFSISTAGYRLSFPAGSPYVLLGTTLAQFIPAEVIPATPVYTTGAYSELAPNVAAFNNITNIYLHSSLTNNSVFSGDQSDIIASIIPNVSIGSIQQYDPFQWVYIDASQLSGGTISQIRLYLTDQVGASVQLTDNWGAVLVIARPIEPKITLNSIEPPKSQNFVPLQ